MKEYQPRRIHRKNIKRSHDCHGKRRYRDKLEAKLALAGTKRESAVGNRNEKRYYHCERCNGYHLTSWVAQYRRTEDD